jgi:hypothetical protein
MILSYHERQSQLAGRNMFCCICLRTIRIDSTTLVEQISDDVYTAYHNHWSTADHDAVDGSIFLRPLRELKVLVFARDLAQCQSGSHQQDTWHT